MIDLSNSGLCLETDCEKVFDITASSGCPACGSRTVVLLASWVIPLKHEISLAREVLSVEMPERPKTIFGIPIVEDASIPEGTFRLVGKPDPWASKGYEGPE